MATKFLDFAKLKEHVRIESVVGLLALDMTQKGAQWRGECPTCKSGGPRALAVNTDKQSYYCFAEGKGGDIIALTAHIRGLSQRDAAELIEKNLGNSDTVHSAPVTVPSQRPQPQPRKQGFDAEAYAKTLDPAHAALEHLNVSQDTLREFKAGYSSSGINRGKLALPLHDREGNVVGYCGRSLKGESPLLTFVNGTDPREFIFNSHKVQAGELYLVHDPLQVLQAAENGISNVVSFLTPITAQSLEMLASLMDERKVETVELF
jgi:DNA primase